MKPRQRGQPTYRRTILMSVFEGYSFLEKILYDIASKAEFKVKNGFEDISVQQFPKTKLGPSGKLTIRDNSSLKYEVGLFRDGWRVQLFVYNTYPSSELQKNIFGETNRTSAWTQETEKVPDIIAELSGEARKA